MSAQRIDGEALAAPADFNPLMPKPNSDPFDEKEETEREANAAYSNLIFSLAKEKFIDLHRCSLKRGKRPHFHMSFIQFTGVSVQRRR